LGPPEVDSPGAQILPGQKPIEFRLYPGWFRHFPGLLDCGVGKAHDEHPFDSSKEPGRRGETMKLVKYPESIICEDCHSPVKMVDCRLLDKAVKGKTHVEFDTVCVACGRRFSVSRDLEYLQYSEREFCKTKEVVATVKHVGKPAPSKTKIKI
jgi:hypothetical protein